MQRVLKSGCIVAVLIVIAIVVVVNVDRVAEDMLCNTTVLSEDLSPNSGVVATTFYRDCGVGSSGNTSVVLRASDVMFEPTSKRIFAMDGKVHVKIHWENEKRLSVNFNGIGSPHIEQSNWEDVAVVISRRRITAQ